MTLLGVCEHTVLSCLLWFTMALGPVCGEFHVAYVTDHSLHTCECERELPRCSQPDASTCICKEHSLQRSEGNSLQRRSLTVWYSSPPNVALLLHNAEVRHLSLGRCSASAVALGSVSFTAGARPSPENFVVQRLEQLTVWRSPPPCQSGEEMYLGREAGAAHHEEARIAVINTAALAGELSLKAYTVRTGLDADGLLPFPDLQKLPREGLPDSSNIFVTFLYGCRDARCTG